MTLNAEMKLTHDPMSYIIGKQGVVPYMVLRRYAKL